MAARPLRVYAQFVPQRSSGLAKLNSPAVPGDRRRRLLEGEPRREAGDSGGDPIAGMLAAAATDSFVRTSTRLGVAFAGLQRRDPEPKSS